MDNFLGYGRIKNRAIVGNDMMGCEWEDNGEIFKVFSFNKERYKLIANGYGSFEPGEQYGNGAVYAKQGDVEFKKVETKPTQEAIKEIMKEAWNNKSHESFGAFLDEAAEGIMVEHQTQIEALQDVVQEVVDWNTKYPSSHIYNESSIRRIAAEMDVIFEKAKGVLGETRLTDKEIS